MKYLKIIFFLAIVLGTQSCKDDPWSDISDGKWNHERTILDIKFNGQVGTATIETTDDTTGTIDVKLATDIISDLSKVEIQSLSTSYKAVSSSLKGDYLDFSKSAPTITITSQTGESRVYTINMIPFTESLAGTYSINDLYVYGGTGPEYGGGACLKPADKDWCWSKTTGPNAETDNYLVFSMSQILSNGNTTGECINYAGKDKHNWDCILLAYNNKEGSGDVNLEKFYRQIPKGKSTWLRDYSKGTITFTDSNGKTTTGKLMDKGSYTFFNANGYTISLNVPNQSFGFTLSGTDDWSNIYSDYDKFVKNPRGYYILVTKCSSNFVIPNESKTFE